MKWMSFNEKWSLCGLKSLQISTSGQYGSSLPSDFDKRSQICISLARRKWYVPINHVTFNVRTVCLNGIPGN